MSLTDAKLRTLKPKAKLYHAAAVMAGRGDPARTAAAHRALQRSKGV